MTIKQLHLVNFRNLAKVDLDFEPITMLIGNNAQGKTNILESIYFLATTKSLRAERELQLIRQGEDFCRVEGELDEKYQGESEDQTKLEIAMQLKPENPLMVEKRVRVNGVSRRVIDYVGHLVVVYFSPEDINLVTGAPSLRRNYIDLSLIQVDREYKRAYVTYTTALSSRNRLLKRIKEGLARVSELDYWTEQMMEAAKIISAKREEFFEMLNQESASLGKINPSMGQFKFIYDPSLLTPKRSQEYLPREIASGTSLIGPHRDDFSFELSGKNLAYFGSRGEQRTAVLELKLAELKFNGRIKKTRPVLLLDDVFSELDSAHREYVISVISDQQTILSAVETENIPQKFLKQVKLVRVEKGEIS